MTVSSVSRTQTLTALAKRQRQLQLLQQRDSSFHLRMSRLLGRKAEEDPVSEAEVAEEEVGMEVEEEAEEKVEEEVEEEAEEKVEEEHEEFEDYVES